MMVSSKGDLEMITSSSINMLVVALLTVLSAILGVAMSAHISASVGKERYRSGARNGEDKGFNACHGRLYPLNTQI